MRSPTDIIATGAWITPAERADLVGRIAELDAKVFDAERSRDDAIGRCVAAQAARDEMHDARFSEARQVDALKAKLAEAHAALAEAARRFTKGDSEGVRRILCDMNARENVRSTIEQAEAKFAESESIRADQAIKRGIAEAKLARVVARAGLSDAPCDLCGYNGPGYYQPNTHPCAALAAMKEKK